MRVKKYCCDSSKLSYQNYYANQAGSGMPFYVGSKQQRGHGLGSILSGLFKSAAPILKKGLSSLGKNALKTGISIAGDVLEGKQFGEAAKTRIPSGIKNLVKDVGFISRDAAPFEEDTEQTVNRNRSATNKRKKKIASRKISTNKRRKFAGDTLD